ncbi:MAG: hypothetical protein ACTSYA_11150, partial [Candidatus Kariarchaeaceae archaeon]
PYARYAHSKKHRTHRRKGSTPEVVSNLKELKISAKHLIEAGDVTFFFKEIDKLVFDETVTNEILSKKVHGIRLCGKVIMSKKISKLLKLGLEHSPPKYHYPSEGELKDITIRRVSSELYDLFASEARKEEMSHGEYFSNMLSKFNNHLQITTTLISNHFRNPLVIDNIEELEVTEADLEILKGRDILFYNIGNLIFEEEIPSELFIDRVGKIVRCKKVKLPRNIPFLIGISRTEESEIYS